uniref:Uncharacterized protein n=1 Tax=Anguilla anguilla TaxID=7936 RepID=A0A0E9RQN8_ANGAN
MQGCRAVARTDSTSSGGKEKKPNDGN